jgi:hypothetical protein
MSIDVNNEEIDLVYYNVIGYEYEMDYNIGKKIPLFIIQCKKYNEKWLLERTFEDFQFLNKEVLIFFFFLI